MVYSVNIHIKQTPNDSISSFNWKMFHNNYRHQYRQYINFKRSKSVQTYDQRRKKMKMKQSNVVVVVVLDIYNVVFLCGCYSSLTLSMGQKVSLAFFLDNTAGRMHVKRTLSWKRKTLNERVKLIELYFCLKRRCSLEIDAKQ